jgi:hypothetical protein
LRNIALSQATVQTDWMTADRIGQGAVNLTGNGHVGEVGIEPGCQRCRFKGLGM